MDTAKNEPYHASSLRVLEIAKIGLSENLTHIPSGIFAKISRREKFPIYGIDIHVQLKLVNSKWMGPEGNTSSYPKFELNIGSL